MVRPRSELGLNESIKIPLYAPARELPKRMSLPNSPISEPGLGSLAHYDISMLEITPDHIALLNDTDLRELIGRLCEADLRRRGISASFVTWGGDQNAADGGFDVRVALPSASLIDGFIPAPNTGFQVKATDMPPSKIAPEMCPNGILRPVIQELADQAGAYIVVSSQGSTSDIALRNRREAMSEALGSAPNAAHLKLDFYDRTRVATWVGDHTGLVLWVREKIGKAVQGWQAYGNWSLSPTGIGDKYLLDNKTRLRAISSGDDQEYSILDGINRLRRQLESPGTAVRLVGLSGVGKTRLVQALFDARVGDTALGSALAIYTNMSDNPDPQPFGFLSDLLASKSRAIVIVDNCPPDLHKRLSDLCRTPDRTLSVLTVEYDIQDDLPEGSEVYELRPSSNDLIESLLRVRFPNASLVDLQRVVEFSEGNARIALVLAATAQGYNSLAGLNDRDLFSRLFYQRQVPDNSLLAAAEVCSLVYSFNGEDVSDDSELAALGALISRSAQDIYQHLAELKRRDLVQQRSVWRAVLPHAIANRLASLALQNVPLTTTRVHLIDNAPDRLLTSFSRRLGYLHTSPEAVAIVKNWLSPDGLLGMVGQLDELGRTLLRNVAPVCPESVLYAIERAALTSEEQISLSPLISYFDLLRSLAYEAESFERCIRVMKKIVLIEDGDIETREKTEVFASLFSPYLSGTQATIEQRLAIVKEMLTSRDEKERSLGIAALEISLETSHFFSSYNFGFGARPRDFGSELKTSQDVQHWYGSAVRLATSLVSSNALATPSILQLFTRKLRGLWTWAGVFDDVEDFCRTVVSQQFWPDGWAAVRTIQYFDAKSFPPEVVDRLKTVEEMLRAKNVVEQVRSTVFGTGFVRFVAVTNETYSETESAAQYERMEESARKLGFQVATDSDALDKLLPEIFTADGRMWSFGRGLAEGAKHVAVLWKRLIEQFAGTDSGKRSSAVLQGFLYAVNVSDPEMANSFLDTALGDSALVRHLPRFEIVVGISQSGFNRLLHALVDGKTPVEEFGNLAYGKATDPLSGAELSKLLKKIAAEPRGFGTAIFILQMRLDHGSHRGEESEVEVHNVGRELLRDYDFKNGGDVDDFNLSRVARVCLDDAAGAPVVRQMCKNLRTSISRYESITLRHGQLISAMFSAQPLAALDGFFVDDSTGLTDQSVANNFAYSALSPFDLISDDELIVWCDIDPMGRYPLAAAGVIVFDVGPNKIPIGWSSKARLLLRSASNRIAVLERFINRFSPISWWGSRAAIMEASTKLLDDLNEYGDQVLTEFAGQQRERLFREIDEERRFETARDTRRDERFE